MDEKLRANLEDAVYRALEDEDTFPSDVTGEVEYIVNRWVEELELED